MAGVLAFIGGFILVLPLRCMSITTYGRGISRYDCTNVIGLDVSGIGRYSPSWMPPLAAGLATGVLLAAAVWFLFRRRAREA